MTRIRAGTPWALALCMVAAMLLAAPANAATVYGSYEFNNITNNTNANGEDYRVQISYDNALSEVYFIFSVVDRGPVTGNTGAIDIVYWSYSQPPALLDDVLFTAPASWKTDPPDSPNDVKPDHLPGSTILVAAEVDAQAGAGSNSARIVEGTGSDKATFTFKFDKGTDTNISDTLNTLFGPTNPDRLWIGLHVQSIGVGGESDSFLLGSPVPVPLPAAAPLGLLGMGVFGAVRAIRRKKS